MADAVELDDRLAAIEARLERQDEAIRAIVNWTPDLGDRDYRAIVAILAGDPAE